MYTLNTIKDEDITLIKEYKTEQYIKCHPLPTGTKTIIRIYNMNYQILLKFTINTFILVTVTDLSLFLSGH